MFRKPVLQATRRQRGGVGANGSVPQGQGRSEVEEDSFIGHGADTNIVMTDGQDTGRRGAEDADQDDFVRVVRGVLGNSGANGAKVAGPAPGHAPGLATCSKLDIIRMDPGPGGVADVDQDDLVRVVRGLLDKENQQNKVGHQMMIKAV